ncbi:nuclear transport factor 2 family protein [Anaerotardibacter muris]|uniref:nuclear transport factor 2 family protein n=1 Tax=Anaerotardibacter muris TaxID=2941505 RepID=UPI0020417805|nr:nuclear transport factor 2 family protein [Anaerotardibacter muris]
MMSQDALARYKKGTDEYECARLYDELCAYSMDKDGEGIRRLCAGDYALIHMTGMVQTRDEYIAAVLDGTLNYYSTEHDSIDVEVAPDAATARIRGRSRINAAVFGGGRNTWRLQQDLRAEKRDGRWVLVESRASTY